jgi:hypothetical protein
LVDPIGANFDSPMAPTTDAIKNLLIQAFDHRDQAQRGGDARGTAYWNGYIGGLQQVIATRTAIQ